MGPTIVRVENRPFDAKIELEEWKAKKNKANREIKEEKKKGDSVDEAIVKKNERLVQEADLEIRRCALELALKDAEGERNDELMDQLKVAKRDLAIFRGEIVDGAGGSQGL
ncbi:hypothetical protein DL768_005857 [Monosporascus sp. mg162]|nr:hypothetical protein DL768_005857 [Monosporascus sp. mg162]